MACRECPGLLQTHFIWIDPVPKFKLAALLFAGCFFICCCYFFFLFLKEIVCVLINCVSVGRLRKARLAENMHTVLSCQLKSVRISCDLWSSANTPILPWLYDSHDFGLNLKWNIGRPPPSPPPPSLPSSFASCRSSPVPLLYRIFVVYG